MTPFQAREIFSSWKPDLKAALKGAAIRNHWQADDWPYQIAMCVEALTAGRATESDLIAEYQLFIPEITSD
jgi:hypothetical protein